MDAIHAELRLYGSEAQRHSHDHHQIVLPRQGALELEVAQRGGFVAPGTGAFIVAGEPHAFSAAGDNRFVVLDLAAGDRDPGRFLAAPFFAIGAEAQGLLDYLAERLARQTSPADALPMEALAMVGGLLLDALAPGPEPRQAALERALAFMRARLAHPIVVADIAAASGLSPSRLHALFRDQIGRTPHDVLTGLRLDRARRLLARTDLPIAEIALRTGHADQSALTRRLRAADGITPAAFRRRTRGLA